jgi:hypothetical protein
MSDGMLSHQQPSRVNEQASSTTGRDRCTYLSKPHIGTMRVLLDLAAASYLVMISRTQDASPVMSQSASADRIGRARKTMGTHSACCGARRSPRRACRTIKNEHNDQHHDTGAVR